jgi:effector-binding domain-containing protein
VFLDIEEVEDEAGIKQAFKSSEKYLKISSWLIEGQVYTSLSKVNMENEAYDKFTYFIEIVSIEEELNEQLRIIPENEYACITFLGPYRDIEKHYKILFIWIEENGYEITGDSIEKNIVDYDFSDSESEYVSEIQIPIARKKTI